MAIGPHRIAWMSREEKLLMMEALGADLSLSDMESTPRNGMDRDSTRLSPAWLRELSSDLTGKTRRKC